MRNIFSSLLLALALIAAPAFAEVPTTEITNDFTGIGYSLTSGGEVQVYVAPRDMGGKVAICGFVLFLKATATTRSIERQGTEKIIFRLGDTALRVQTDLFKRYKSEEDIAASGKAGCSGTNLAWDPSYAKSGVKMELGNFTIRH